MAFGPESRSYLIACIVGLGLAVAWPALAGPGDHIRFGMSTFTPTLRLGADFSTNPYRAEGGSTPSVALQLTPSLRLTTDAPDIKLDLGAAYLFEKHFTRASSNLDKFTDFDIDGRVHLYPESVLSMRLSDRLTLRSRNVERPTASVAYNNQLRNAFEGSVPIQAGPVLVFEPGGEWGYDEYFVANFGGVGLRPFNNSNAYGPTFEAEWSFFPMTAVIVEGGYTWTRWRRNWVPTNNQNSELGDFFGLPDSQSWEARTGMRGRITPKLVFVGTIGYGEYYIDEQSVVDDGGTAAGLDVDLKGPRGIVGAAQLAWQFGPGQELRVGYQRDFASSWFTNWVAYDEVFLGAKMRVGARLGLDAEAKLRFEGYEGAVTRNDTFVRATAGGAYFFADWISADLRVGWDQRISNNSGVAFGDFGAFAGATLTY